MARADRLVVVWRVTEACNLACGFCRYDKRLGFERRSAERERAERIGEIFASAGRSVHVSFLGGEPLLWPPFREVVRLFRHRFGLGTGVTTNGLLLASKPFFECALTDLDELTVSIDGLGPVHDRLRGWPGGFALLSSVIERIADEKRRRGRGPLIRVNTILMRDNAASFAAFARELATLGVEELTFNQLGGNDRPEFFAEHRLRATELERFVAELPLLRGELAARGLELRGSADYLERIAATTTGRRLPVSDCGPGEDFVYVAEDGIASPCSFTTDSFGVPIAGSEVMAAQFRRIRDHAAPSACADCPSTQVFGKFRSFAGG